MQQKKTSFFTARLLKADSEEHHPVRQMDNASAYPPRDETIICWWTCLWTQHSPPPLLITSHHSRPSSVHCCFLLIRVSGGGGTSWTGFISVSPMLEEGHCCIKPVHICTIIRFAPGCWEVAGPVFTALGTPPIIKAFCLDYAKPEGLVSP